MDYYSHVAKRTRLQSDLYLKTEAEKRKKKRYNSRVREADVVFLGEKKCDSVETESSGLRTPKSPIDVDFQGEKGAPIDIDFHGEKECRSVEAESSGFDDFIYISSDEEFVGKSGGSEKRKNGVQNDGDKSQGVSSISESASDFDFMSSSNSGEDDDDGDDEDYYVGKCESSDSMEEDSSFYDDDDDDDSNGESSDGGGGIREAFKEKTENENAGLSISGRESEEEEEKDNQFASREESFSGGNIKKKLESEHTDTASFTAGCEEVEEKGKAERNVNGGICEKNGEADDAKNKKFEEEKESENAGLSFASDSKSKEKEKFTFFSSKKKNIFGRKSEKRHGYMDSGGSRVAFRRNQKKVEDDDANKEECRAKKGSENEGLPICERKAEEVRGTQSSSHIPRVEIREYQKDGESLTKEECKASENEGLPFCERKTKEERGTQSSSHIPRVEIREYQKDGESSTKVFEEKQAEEKEEKEHDKTNDKFNGGDFKKEKGEEKEMSWKGWEFGSKRKQFGAMKDYDVFGLLAKSIWEKGELFKDVVASEEEAPKQETMPPVVEEQLPLKFTFGIEEPEPEEKSEFEKELDKLWAEMQFALKSSEIGSHTAPVVNDAVTHASDDKKVTTRCCQGKHSLVLDEEVGIKCIYCSLIEVEIRYVTPPMEKFPFPSKATNKKTSSSEDDVPMFDGLQFQACGSKSEEPCYQKEGTVWDTIPGIRESMFQHQQDGFEFIWKNLTGTIELDKLKSSDSNDIGGCIISHAPGTGKTRLTIVFLQTYLELFPKCRPVIIAPSSLLLTWEDEFRKWNIGIPFHNLNNPEFSGKENTSAMEILEGNRHHSHSKNTIRMVKLFTWCKSKSILGISYSLYEKLAGEKIDKETKKETVLNREGKELKKILLELPDLLVLDEGHRPRNKRSCIWKVMSKLQTQKRIILSGTPFQNNFIELCNTLCLVKPAFPDMIPATLKNFCQKKRMQGRRKQQASLSSPVDRHAPDDEIKKLRTLMAPFVHVHKGSILQKNLPGLRDSVVVLNPPNLQKRLLENMESSQNTFVFEHKLAVVSVHPSLFLCCNLSEKEESIIGPDQKQQLEIIKRNPCEGVKTRFLVEFIRLCEAIEEKVLVFSQFIDPLSLIIEQLNSKFSWSEGKEILHMHGKLEHKQRKHLINTFNDPNSQAKVLLASMRACSEGINLVGASRVILLDVVWNPSVERQAISRAYRLGQKRVVYTYHLITQGTAECDKYCKQAEKDRISELVFSSSKKENDKGKSSAEVSEDKILYEMVRHPNLKDMFEKIISQPKESDLVESFGSVALP